MLLVQEADLLKQQVVLLLDLKQDHQVVVHLVAVANEHEVHMINVFDKIKENKEKTTANLDKTKECPVCGEPMVPSYSKGIKVFTCVKHNVCVPEVE
mgnify:CR=1 FL=1